MYQKIDQFLEGQDLLLIHQIKEWVEIFTNLETRNKYQILDKSGQKSGFIAEKGGGILGTLLRLVLRIRRPMNIVIWDQNQQEVLHIRRPFYFIWSNMEVTCAHQTVGHIRRRFSLLNKVYDIEDRRGNILGRIKSSIWKLWVFPVFDPKEKAVIGKVSKNWGGFLKEYFTDADRFRVEFPSSWSNEEKALFLAAAISIDLDFFEENEGSR